MEHIIISRGDAIQHLLDSEIEHREANSEFNEGDEVSIQAQLEALNSDELILQYRVYASEDPDYLLTVELM
jgi:acyl-CoA thioesterase FadM